MDGPLLPDKLVDFGPCALSTDGTVPRLHIVHGPRPASLRGEIRLHCPRKPGTYGMIDGNGELIYVGKAKSLRARLFSYFRRKGRDRRATRIIAQTRTIAWEVSAHEFAALHRELELIRRWRPRLNVQGQPRRRRFAYVCLGRHPAAYVFLARRPPASAVVSFGPIPLGERAREAVRRLNDGFQLRDCPQAQDMIFADDDELFPSERTPGCLRLEIGTCLGPCAAACTREAYSRQVRAARTFLAGTHSSLPDRLEGDMKEAASTQQFERAAALRDKLESLRWLTAKLDQVRRLRTTFSFIYPVMGHERKKIWYLIHGGRTVAALPEPRDSEAATAAATLIESIYQGKAASSLLEHYEHYDSLLLVASWFRRKPNERQRTMTPAEALARCRK